MPVRLANRPWPNQGPAGKDAAKLQSTVSHAGGLEMPLHRYRNGAGSFPDLQRCRCSPAVADRKRNLAIEFQSRIAKVELVHDLVVVIEWSWVISPRERRRVGSFEIDDLSSL